MGVRGLSSYVTGCQRACSEHVDLNYRGSDRDTPTAAADRDGPASLAVDGLALVYHVMKNTGVHDLRLELGCDYRCLHDALLGYLSALTNAGVSLLVIVDGMQDCEKEATTLERRRSQASDASEAMELMQPGGEGADAACLQQHCSSLLPLFAVETLAAACISAGVSIRSADREADPELAAACQGGTRSHRSPESYDAGGGVGVEGGCDAVLSNDSDFLVMDIPGYIPFWSLGVGADGSAGALVFRRPLLAARLGIPADRMPDLACLVGNDWIQPDNHVHRQGQIIMQSAATSGRSNNGHDRKRKGTAAHNAGGALASSSAPCRRSGNGNGSSSSSSSNGPTGAASAKHLVEATARYLSEFLRRTKVVRDRCGANGAVSLSQVGSATEGYDRGRLLAGETDQSMARELCARFFPALTAGHSGGGPGAEEGAQGQSQAPPQTGLAGTSSTKSAGHRAPKQQRASRARKGKGHKNKRRPSGSSDRGGGGGSTTGCGSRGRQQDDGMGEEDAAGEESDAVGEEEEDGESFLREFLAARLHYEV
ncbi:unnamed protein product, partial [Ectocarpus fasciculatus]